MSWEMSRWMAGATLLPCATLAVAHPTAWMHEEDMGGAWGRRNHFKEVDHETTRRVR